MCVPTRTYLTFNNDKPWFSTKLKQLRQAKEDAYRSGDKALYKQAKYTLNREIRVAKKNYSGQLKNSFQATTLHQRGKVWKPSPATRPHPPALRPVNNWLQVWKTKAWSDTPHPLWPSHNTAINTLPLPPPTVSQPVLKICEDDVSKVFRRQKIRRAKGPDDVSPACLKACAVQLSSIFTLIFNRSLELCEVPSCFKRSTIIPVPKKPKFTGLNDYRPVALTSVVIKPFERLVLAHLKDSTWPLLDPLQFAYRANRSVDDAVNMGLHYILQHLDKLGTYARILFVDFSSAFNTIIPDTPQNKLTQLSVPTSICQWITSFLTDRQQLVRLGELTSNTRTISTGAPQGCPLSPLLFSLYTNDCTSTDPSVRLLKFADDTTVICLIQDGDESAYRQEVEQLAGWCSHNNLELNTLKTVDMIVDFRRNLWLQWSHSGSWEPPSLRTWSGTLTLTPSWKRLSRGCSSFVNWKSSTCHRRIWHSFTLLLLSRFCAPL